MTAFNKKYGDSALVTGASSRIKAGQKVEPRELVSISSWRVQIPDPERLVHLQFRRFAGCPVCNLHLQSLVKRHREIDAAGIREVVVFHSPVAAMLPYQHELPFAVIADPTRKLYVQFGVETSPRALLDPRAWWAGLRGVFKRWSLPTNGESIVGLPADFLIARDGRVLAYKYGVHADDQWSVDELLALASSSVARSTPSQPV